MFSVFCLGSLNLRILLSFPGLNDHSWGGHSQSHLRQKFHKVLEAICRLRKDGKVRESNMFWRNLSTYHCDWYTHCHFGNWVEDNCLHYFSSWKWNLNKSNLTNFELPVKEAEKSIWNIFPGKGIRL